MPINPLISLQGQVPDVGKTFSNALLNVGRIDELKRAREEAPIRQRLLEAATQAKEAAVPTEQQMFNQANINRITSMAQGASEIIPDLQRGNVDRVRATLQQRGTALDTAGIPRNDTDEALRLLETNPQELLKISEQAVQLGTNLTPSKTAFQFGAQETVKDSVGNLFQSTQRRNPATGAVEPVLSPIGGGPAQPVGEVSLVSPTGLTAEEQIKQQEKEAKIGVTKAREIERAKLIEKRGSEITQQLSQRNRDAARSERTLNQALTLAQQATQGFTGASKLRLSRLVPGIDVADEAALDATLKQLALEQLQAFKGPTTDFEFGVTQAIAGGVGQSQTANIARVKSLKRATWFNKREFDQFEKHKKSGGDPDSFRFNFGEPIKTKKGVFTLQDIQDTAVQNNLTIEETIRRLNK